MKKDLGDHIGKKRGWFWYEAWEGLKLAYKHRDIVIETIKKIFPKKKVKN